MSEERRYDSTADTLMHIKSVSSNLMSAAMELLRRAMVHDNSKLQSPEKDLFDEYTECLAACTYGSDEYTAFLAKLKPALDHHYANNTHHPEHYPNGIDGFDLFDLIEMYMDWESATKRHNDGNIMKSIVHNKIRFKMSDQLTSIFINTAMRRKQ